MPSWASSTFTFSAGAGLALMAARVPRLQELFVSDLSTVVLPLTSRLPWPSSSSHPLPVVNDTTFQCRPQNYTTQLVSLDPLVVYIHDFLHPAEMDNILAASEELLKPSTVTKYGKTVESEYRTSWSAEIPRSNAAVRCVEQRVWAFMGSMMARGKDAIEPPQVVRYTAGQKFDMHHDWYERPQPEWRGRRRAWNRLASFFAILQENCTEGETYFPYVKPFTDTRDGWEADGPPPAWRRHEDGGLAFRPVRGNALFWVNLFPSGEGDPRVEHAGLPVGGGVKTAMNIWPRQYIGPEAWDPPPEAAAKAAS